MRALGIAGTGSAAWPSASARKMSSASVAAVSSVSRRVMAFSGG
jgi:hypothetical protein